MPQVGAHLALAQLLGAARLGHVGQVRVGRQVVAEAAGDEDLPRRVREVLHRADHVRDPEVVVVDRARQVVEATAVGALHDVVLLERPLERHRPPHEVVERARAVARHLQAHDGAPPLGLERRRLRGRLRHPAPAVEEAHLVALRGFALGLYLVRGRVVAVGVPAREQPLDRFPMPRPARRLEVRRVRPLHLGPLVPIEPEPAKAVEDRLQGLLEVALPVGVVDAQDELPAVPPREQPVEQGGPHAADVQVAGRAGREPRADAHARPCCIITRHEA